MFKRNKLKIILSSIIVLLPILFGIIYWNDLPDIMAIHWGPNGKADGFSSKAFTVFALPLILLVIHLACVFFTLLDKNQKEQNKKVLSIMFWIVPAISLISNSAIYNAAFDKEFETKIWLSILIGIMFIFIGNYLPKIKQNKTIGIKIYWTLTNEVNWNKTHRFSGKLWILCGIVILISTFLPINSILFIFISTLSAVVLPLAYSYNIYRKQKKSEK